MPLYLQGSTVEPVIFRGCNFREILERVPKLNFRVFLFRDPNSSYLDVAYVVEIFVSL